MKINLLFKFFILCLFLIMFTDKSWSIKKDKKFNEALFEAVQFQDIENIKKLISKGADVNYQQNGRPILGWASQNGNLEIVKLLIEAKADVNAVDEGPVGHTPLIRAIEMQKVSIVQALLDAKANPNVKTPDGETCLILGVKSDKPEIVTALINAGADVKYVSADGESPVLVATQQGSAESIEIIKLLGTAGANLNASNAAYTPLIYAVQQGNLELVKILLNLGANPNGKTKDNNTPLHIALDKKEILQTLIDTKADPDIENSSGEPPLIDAIRYNYLDAVNILLNAKANINKKTIYGTTPLELAKQNANPEIINLFEKLTVGTTNKNIKQVTGSKCSIVDAAKKQMEIHGLLQAQVNAGKSTTDIFRTFNDDTKDYAELLTSDPNKACDLLETLRIKYGL